MKTISPFYCLLICWATMSAAAATNLPILDAFPRCEYTIIKQFDLTKRRLTDAASQQENQQKLITEILNTIRQYATEEGADAVILQHLESKTPIAVSSGRYKTSAGFEIVLNAHADAIKLCEEDVTLPMLATPFNDQGYRNALMRLPEISIRTKLTLKRPADSGAPKKVIKSDVSLQHGFYGVQPGMTSAELEDIWGPADAEFQLQQKDYKAVAYGRQYWLLLYKDKIISIDSRHPLLSANITSQFNDNEAFNYLSWQLDGRFGQRTSLTQLKEHYLQLQPQSNNQYSLQQGDHQLQLEFADYRDVRSDTQETILNQIRLQSAGFSQAAQQELAVILPLHQLKSDPATPFSQRYWQNILQPLPILNQAVQADGSSITIYNALLAAIFQKQQVKEIQLLSVYQKQNSESLQQTLKYLGMPQTKTAFLQQFPDSFDALGKLIYYGEQLEISALYSETKDNQLESLTIRFM